MDNKEVLIQDYTLDYSQIMQIQLQATGYYFKLSYNIQQMDSCRCI